MRWTVFVIIFFNHFIWFFFSKDIYIYIWDVSKRESNSYYLQKRIVLYSITKIGRNQLDLVRYSFEYGIWSINNCGNSHMAHMAFSHQSILVEEMEISLFFFDEKCGKKNKRDPVWNKIKLCYLFSLSQERKRWIDVFFFYWIWIHRDWRGSNPQLPPWQGGALTNWTTIPGK